MAMHWPESSYTLLIMTTKLELSYLVFVRSTESIQAITLIKQLLTLFINSKLNLNLAFLFLIMLIIIIQQFATF
jgi:hypothetical protein